MTWKMQLRPKVLKEAWVVLKKNAEKSVKTILKIRSEKQ